MPRCHSSLAASVAWDAGSGLWADVIMRALCTFTHSGRAPRPLSYAVLVSAGRVKASRSAAVSTLSTPPRRVLPQTTYRVECELHKWLAQNLKCDVAGRIVELEPDARGKEVVVASCMATMCNPAQIPGQGYD